MSVEGGLFYRVQAANLDIQQMPELLDGQRRNLMKPGHHLAPFEYTDRRVTQEMDDAYQDLTRTLDVYLDPFGADTVSRLRVQTPRDNQRIASDYLRMSGRGLITRVGIEAISPDQVPESAISRLTLAQDKPPRWPSYHIGGVVLLGSGLFTAESTGEISPIKFVTLSSAIFGDKGRPELINVGTTLDYEEVLYDPYRARYDQERIEVSQAKTTRAAEAVEDEHSTPNPQGSEGSKFDGLTVVRNLGKTAAKKAAALSGAPSAAKKTTAKKATVKKAPTKKAAARKRS